MSAHRHCDAEVPDLMSGGLPQRPIVHGVLALSSTPTAVSRTGPSSAGGPVNRVTTDRSQVHMATESSARDPKCNPITRDGVARR